MNRTAYQMQKIFFALGTVCTLTVYGGDSLDALDRAKARVLEIVRKRNADHPAQAAVTFGYAAEEAKRILLAAGVTEAVIRIGGTTVSIGGSRRIGIRHPFREDNADFAFVDVENKAVVTRQLRDETGVCTTPRTLRLADESLASVTLIGENAVQLSALCNNVFPMTLKDAKALLNDTDVEAIFVTETQEVFTTDGLMKQNDRNRRAA